MISQVYQRLSERLSLIVLKMVMDLVWFLQVHLRVFILCKLDSDLVHHFDPLIRISNHFNVSLVILLWVWPNDRSSTSTSLMYIYIFFFFRLGVALRTNHWTWKRKSLSLSWLFIYIFNLIMVINLKTLNSKQFTKMNVLAGDDGGELGKFSFFFFYSLVRVLKCLLSLTL